MKHSHPTPIDNSQLVIFFLSSARKIYNISLAVSLSRKRWSSQTTSNATEMKCNKTKNTQQQQLSAISSRGRSQNRSQVRAKRKILIVHYFFPSFFSEEMRLLMMLLPSPSFSRSWPVNKSDFYCYWFLSIARIVSGERDEKKSSIGSIF